MSKLTDEEKRERMEKIYNLYHKEKLSFRQIGKLVNLSRQGVKNVLEKHPKHQSRTLSESHKVLGQKYSKKKINLYIDLSENDKMSAEDISNLTGDSLEDVKGALYNPNLVELYHEFLTVDKMTPEEISKITGDSIEEVKNILKQYGQH